jgi:hypothetical protein
VVGTTVVSGASVSDGASVVGVEVSTVSGVVVVTEGGTDVVGASVASVAGGSVDTTGSCVVAEGPVVGASAGSVVGGASAVLGGASSSVVVCGGSVVAEATGAAATDVRASPNRNKSLRMSSAVSASNSPPVGGFRRVPRWLGGKLARSLAGVARAVVPAATTVIAN